MAQVAQDDTVPTRNTRSSSRTRGRNFCFTLNNYTPTEIKQIMDIGADYIFQEETGEQGTPHLQGLLMFKNAKRFNAVKKLIPRAHIETCKNKLASMQYCMKAETRTGEIYTNLDLSKIKWHNDTNKFEHFKKVLREQMLQSVNEGIEEFMRSNFEIPPAPPIRECEECDDGTCERCLEYADFWFGKCD